MLYSAVQCELSCHLILHTTTVYNDFLLKLCCSSLWFYLLICLFFYSLSAVYCFFNVSDLLRSCLLFTGSQDTHRRYVGAHSRHHHLISLVLYFLFYVLFLLPICCMITSAQSTLPVHEKQCTLIRQGRPRDVEGLMNGEGRQKDLCLECSWINLYFSIITRYTPLFSHHAFLITLEVRCFSPNLQFINLFAISNHRFVTKRVLMSLPRMCHCPALLVSL